MKVERLILGAFFGLCLLILVSPWLSQLFGGG